MEGPAGRLHVSDGGQGGVPVVFVHGLTGDADLWRFQLDHLRKTRRALALELRGHGRSDAPQDGSWSLEGLADDIDAATRDLPRFVLVGHSMGGMPLQIFAARRPERLVGLVFADAIGSAQGLDPRAKERLRAQEEAVGADRAKQRALIENLLGAEARPATREQVLAAFDHLSPEGFRALRAQFLSFVPPADVRRLGIPLFSIEVARPEEPPIFFSAMVPEAPRKAIDGVSHWLMLDDPEAFDAALDGFLATLRDQAR